MKVERIVAEPFEFTKLIKCNIQKAVSEHGFAELKGYISYEKGDSYLMMSCENIEVSIWALAEDEESKLIYRGILEELKITYENELCLLEIRVVPYSYLMDLKPNCRTFQIPGMTYQEILNIVAGQYPGGHVLMNIGERTPIGEPIVQYHETDWEFTKRLASHFQAVVVPSYVTSGAKLYFGLVEWSGAFKIFPYSYRIQKRMDEFLYKGQNQVAGLIEDDSLVYVVEDQELYEVGELVEINGRVLYVERSESRLDGHQLWNTYSLKTKAGFQVPKQYNEKIIGASLDGVVTAVQSDVVQVALSVDAQSGAGKWFQFSTVYSSPDGSGWYCMPEPGDEIRLYFPTEQEKHGYVISAVHLPVQTQKQTFGNGAANTNPGVCRCDPNHKTIYTSSGKMVDLSEHSIVLDAGNGMNITLDDTTGISIISPMGVYVKSDGPIDLSSTNGMVEIAGTSSVNIVQKESKIEVSDSNVVYHSANAKVQ